MVICYVPMPYNECMSKGGQHMTRKVFGRLFVISVIIVGIAWPTYRTFQSLKSPSQSEDTGYMLYQVTLLQIELVRNSLDQVIALKSADTLEHLKQSVYSAGYAHERLVLSFGEDELAPLSSLKGLSDWLLRAQIGGERAPNEVEIEALQVYAQGYTQLYEAYKKLFSASHRFIASKNTEISEADQALEEVIRKKLLD